MSRKKHAPPRSLTGAIPQMFLNPDPVLSIMGEAPSFLINRKLTRAQRLALKAGKLRASIEVGHLRALFAAGPDGTHCADAGGQPDDSLPGPCAPATTEVSQP